MPSVKIPKNCSSITLSGNTHTPSAGGQVTPVTDTVSTALNHWNSRPRLRSTAANGDTTILLPSVIGSITIEGIVYTPNAANEIVVPAAAATAFLQECRYIP